MAPESRAFTIYCPALVKPVCETTTTAGAPPKLRAVPGMKPSGVVPPSPYPSRPPPRKRTRQHHQQQVHHHLRQKPPPPGSLRRKDAGGSSRPAASRTWGGVLCNKENVDPRTGEQAGSHPFPPSSSALVATPASSSAAAAAAAAGRDRTPEVTRRASLAGPPRTCGGSSKKRPFDDGSDGKGCRWAPVGSGSGGGKSTAAPSSRKSSREPLRELWSSSGNAGGGSLRNLSPPFCLDALRARAMR